MQQFYLKDLIKLCSEIIANDLLGRVSHMQVTHLWIFQGDKFQELKQPCFQFLC